MELWAGLGVACSWPLALKRYTVRPLATRTDPRGVTGRVTDFAPMSRLLDEVHIRRTMRSPAELREARLAAGLTQARVALDLGVARVTLNRWERERHTPRFDQAMAWSTLMEDVTRTLRRAETARALQGTGRPR